MVVIRKDSTRHRNGLMRAGFPNCASIWPELLKFGLELSGYSNPFGKRFVVGSTTKYVKIRWAPLCILEPLPGFVAQYDGFLLAGERIFEDGGGPQEVLRGGVRRLFPRGRADLRGWRCLGSSNGLLFSSSCVADFGSRPGRHRLGLSAQRTRPCLPVFWTLRHTLKGMKRKNKREILVISRGHLSGSGISCRFSNFLETI